MARYRFKHTTAIDLEDMARRRCKLCAEGLKMLGRNKYIHSNGKLCEAFELRLQFNQRQERKASPQSQNLGE